MNIPAGPLGPAVITLGQQARVSIAVTDQSLLVLPVPAVAGRMTAEEALRRLLAGTAARAQRVGARVYRVVRTPSPRRRSPSPPPPPTTPSGDEPPIVVTATKRDMMLRHYAGPATVIDGSALSSALGGNGSDLIAERVPTLASTHLGPGRDKLFIRAIGDSSFAGQTQATVGQYFGEARINYNAPDPALRLYDVDAVEILPGPQATLYGAGALGGVLRLVPTAPRQGVTSLAFDASAAMTAHGDPSADLAMVANLALTRAAALRLVGYRGREGGYVDDIGTGQADSNRTRSSGLRALLHARLSDGWRWEAGALLQSIAGRDGQYADRALPGLQRQSRGAQPFANRYRLAFATLRGTLGAADLVSTVSVARHGLDETFAHGEGAEPLLDYRQRTRSSLLVSETRLAEEGSDGSGWLVGLQLLRSRTRLHRADGPPSDLASLPGTDTHVSEQTLFAEVTRPIAPNVKVTAGLRLGHAGLSGQAIDLSPGLEAPRSQRSSWRLLPSLAASIEPAAGTTAYLRYQSGYRPGGFVVRTDIVEEVESDRLSSIEGGIRFGQRRRARVRGALAVAHSKWRDVQADTLDTGGLPTTLKLGDGRLWSLDGDLAWRPAKGVELQLAASFNRSRVTNHAPGLLPIERAPLPNVPSAKIRAGFEAVPFALGDREFRLTGWIAHVGRSTLGFGPMLGRSQGDYVDTALEARWGTAERYLFVKASNLLDEVGNRFALGSMFTIAREDQVTPLQPRTLRLGLHHRL